MPTPEHVLHLRRSIGHELLQLPGICAVVVNSRGEVLLQRRSDSGRWHTIGGVVEPGEGPGACAVREVREECGIGVEVVRVTGVYALPEHTYPNGDRVSYVLTSFLCRPVDEGEVPFVADEESLEVGYFPPGALPEMGEGAVRRVRDALAGRAEAVFE